MRITAGRRPPGVLARGPDLARASASPADRAADRAIASELAADLGEAIDAWQSAIAEGGITDFTAELMQQRIDDLRRKHGLE